MKNLLLCVFVFTAGCASNSGVVPIGKDTFMVSREAGTGFSGTATLKAEAFEEARAFCRGQKRYLQIVNTNVSQPPFIFGNYPKAEVQFMCLSENDPELNRPKLRRDAGASLKVTKDITSRKPDIYTELKKLKELLDSNIITQEEFNERKKIILAQ